MNASDLATLSARKIGFRNDYSEGAHPRLLQALAQASAEQNAGYGLDRHSLAATASIRAQLGRDDVAVHFLSGGTQTNLTALAAFLRPHEAVVAATTGHIATHETGAIEATGHKVIALPSADGKLSPAMIQPVLDEHDNEHMVSPRVVYVSNSTELGTIYSRAELTALHVFCRAAGLYLYLDGARLGSALTAPGNDLSLPDIAALTDAFYIGGTKNGALLGEALVIVDTALQPEFRYLIKQHGAMLAKGMVLGAQFEALFADELFFELAAHANRLAQRLRAAIAGAGFAMASDSPSNQLFPILPQSLVAQLQERYEFELWRPADETTQVIRLVTSWATSTQDVDAFIQDINAFSGHDATAARRAAQGT